MERKAIIIESSNVKGQNDLPGARADADNWQHFLTNKLGGQWNKNEIYVFNKPNPIYIEAILEGFKDNYCFVAFSGHGYYDVRQGTTKICIDDNNLHYDINKLKPRGLKGTLIIDACRGISEPKAMVQRAEFSARSDSAFIKESAVGYESNLWFQHLNSSYNGIVTMYSCSIKESAGEFSGDANAGGYYTSIMIASANRWLTYASSNTCYTTRNAHDATTEYMKTAFPQQNPVYNGYNTFPFAVKA